MALTLVALFFLLQHYVGAANTGGVAVFWGIVVVLSILEWIAGPVAHQKR